MSRDISILHLCIKAKTVMGIGKTRYDDSNAQGVLLHYNYHSQALLALLIRKRQTNKLLV